MKEWLVWIVGWVVYPALAALDTGKAGDKYHEARLACRDWLFSWPSAEKRANAHRLTGSFLGVSD